MTRALAKRTRRLAAIAFLAAMAAACGDRNLVRDAAVATGFGAKPVEPAAFVKAARHPEGDYMPIGVAATPRTVKPRSTADAKKLEESLEAQRLANEAAANSARQAASPAASPAAAKPKPTAEPDN